MEIALIAHDGKKAEMVQFINEYRDFFHQDHISIVATGTTGSKIEAAGFKVNSFKSGPLGGDAQKAARIVEGTCKMVLFFRDPLEKHPHEPDVLMLLRLCDVHDVPLATNPATATLLIKGLTH